MSDLASNSTDKVFPAIQPGQTFAEHFLIKELLGRGGAGSVYRAHDSLLERDTALKLLDPALSADPSSRERFRAEAKTTTLLDHSNIAKVYSYGQENGQLFMAMELIEGQSLSQLLKEKKQLDQETFQSVFVAVLDALAYAHRAGVVHRDLKPGNIMLTVDDDGSLQPKIVDFGLAKLLNRAEQDNTLTAKGSLLGSPLYMSPEQCKSTDVDARSDIYSIACVMYECLAGKTPFCGESAYETMYEHVTRSVPQFNEISGPIRVPRSVALVIIKALSKDRTHRQQSIDQLRQELERAFKDKHIYQGKANLSHWPALLACTIALLSTVVIASVGLREQESNFSAPVKNEKPVLLSIPVDAKGCFNNAMKMQKDRACLTNETPETIAKRKAAKLMAVEYLLKASELCQRAAKKDAQLLYETETQLAYLDQEDGNYQGAIKHLRKALEQYPSRDYPGYLNQLSASTQIAACYRQLKDYPKALQILSAAIKHFEAHESPIEELADSYLMLAEFFQETRNYQKALETNRKSLSVCLNSASRWNSYTAAQAASAVVLGENKLCNARTAQKTLRHAETETDKCDVSRDTHRRYEALADSAFEADLLEDAARLYGKADALVDQLITDSSTRAATHALWRKRIASARENLKHQTK